MKYKNKYLKLKQIAGGDVKCKMLGKNIYCKSNNKTYNCNKIGIIRDKERYSFRKGKISEEYVVMRPLNYNNSNINICDTHLEKKYKHFIDAHEKGYKHGKNYNTALTEMVRGEKKGHYIWYIFPQIKGIIKNPSWINKRFLINDLQSAIEYLQIDILREHYIELLPFILEHLNEDKTTTKTIFSSDNGKFHSSIILFFIASKYARERKLFNLCKEILNHKNAFNGNILDYNSKTISILYGYEKYKMANEIDYDIIDYNEIRR